MAITDVREIGFGKRRCRLTDKYTQELQRVFRVYTADATDTLNEDDLILAATIGVGLPQRWDAHPDDPLALCNEIDCQEEEHPQKWIVTCSYSSEVTDQTRQSQDPLDEPPVVSWSTETYREAVQEDATGTAVRNSAGDVLEGVEAERHRIVVVYEDNVDTFDEADALDYVGKVNEADFRGQERYTWLCRDFVTTGRGFKNDQAYWRRRITFVFDPKTTEDSTGATVVVGWKLRVLDAGYRRLVGGTPITIMDRGQPVSQPVPLDGSGGRLAANGTPVWLTFEPYDTIDFNAIPNFNLDW